MIYLHRALFQFTRGEDRESKVVVWLVFIKYVDHRPAKASGQETDLQ